VTLKGRPVSLEVASVEIVPQPGALDLGTLRPGEEALEKLRFTGAFPAEQATLAFRDRSEILGCVHAALSDTPEGETQAIHVDHDYTLAVRVSPYCGPASREEQFETVLQLVFDSETSGRRLPTVEIPLSFTLDYRIELPETLEMEVTGADSSELPIRIESNVRGAFELEAVVAGPEDAPSWPDDEDHLTLGFAGTGEGFATDENGEPTRVRTVRLGDAVAAAPLTLRAQAHRCCGSGEYRTYLGLKAAPDQTRPPGSLPVEPAVIPVLVRVTSAGFWACHGPWILWALLALLLLLLALYVVNMFRNSRFLDPRRLADRLTPLVWTGMGGTTERTDSRDRVRSMVQRNLSWRHRISAWLRANPLAFGLPGGAYDETVELYLRPHHDPAASLLRLMPERSVVEDVRAQPERYPGRLFGSAKAGTSFVGVPDTQGRICQMVPDGAWSAPLPGDEDEPFKPKPIDLRRTELLRPLEPGDHPDEGDPAGWRIGG
jgi:hypothetical protein